MSDLTQQMVRRNALLLDSGVLRRRSGLLHATAKINFSSSDYLSLLGEQRVQQAYQTGFSKYPAGSGSSMVVCGYHPVHQLLEKTFAEALQVEDCLLFSSGYAANLSVANLLGQFKQQVILDKAVHASIYDGIRLAGIRYQRYRHGDLSDLRYKMEIMNEPSVIMTESIFSMSGQVTNLRAMTQLARTYQHEVLIDEAHAFGVVGKEGLGLIVQENLTQADIPLRVIPFGKALGASGAIVAGQGVWIEALLQTARSHIYSTAMSPAFAYGVLETFLRVREADDRRKKLHEMIGYFRTAVRNSPLKWRDSHSPIQQLQLGCPHLALRCSEYLNKHSIVCLPMRQPTVSKTETGLRVILNYAHQPEQIDRLFKYLHQFIELETNDVSQ